MMYKNYEMMKEMALAYMGGDPEDYDPDTWDMMRDAYWSFMLNERIKFETQSNSDRRSK